MNTTKLFLSPAANHIFKALDKQTAEINRLQSQVVRLQVFNRAAIAFTFTFIAAAAIINNHERLQREAERKTRCHTDLD